MLIIDQDNPRLAFCNEAQFSIPPSGLIEHIKDHWWIVHPERGLVLFNTGSDKRKHWAPQCNQNKDIADRFKPAYPWAEVKFVPSFFRKIDPNDYVS